MLHFLFYFIPKYFVLFGDIIHGIVFSISFLDCLLCMYRSSSDFCILILILAMLWDSCILIGFSGCLGFSVYKIMSSVNKEVFTFSQLISLLGHVLFSPSHISFYHSSALDPDILQLLTEGDTHSCLSLITESLQLTWIYQKFQLRNLSYYLLMNPLRTETGGYQAEYMITNLNSLQNIVDLRGCQTRWQNVLHLLHRVCQLMCTESRFAWQHHVTLGCFENKEGFLTSARTPIKMNKLRNMQMQLPSFLEERLSSGLWPMQSQNEKWHHGCERKCSSKQLCQSSSLSQSYAPKWTPKSKSRVIQREYHTLST